MSEPTGGNEAVPDRPPIAARATAAVKAARQSASIRAQGRGGSRAQRTIGWRNRDIVRTAALVLAVFYGARLFWLANRLFFVVFLGTLFGIAVSGGVDWLRRLVKVPRGIAAALIVLSFVGIMVGFGAWVAPTLREQGGELRQKLPVAMDRVEDWVNARRSGVLGLVLPPKEPTPVAVAPQTPVRGTVVKPAASDSAAKAPGLQDQLKAQMSGLSRYLFPFITSTVEIVGGLLLILFLSIYFAAEPELYRSGLLALLPARKRARGTMVMDRVAVVLRKWLVTQLIAMVTMGVVNTIMLLVFHVKAAFALGVLAGLFEFIPTIGPILSALPGIAMAFLDSPDKAIYVGFAYWFLQFLESHILIPLLMKQGIKLPPALTVITQTLLALVFGFLGLMVAVPLLATCRCSTSSVCRRRVRGHTPPSTPISTSHWRVRARHQAEVRTLFERYPRLAQAIPHVDLGVRETRVGRLSIDGHTVLIKRDDLTTAALGGNKVRALEFLLAGIPPGERVLTAGSVGSTHALATAVYARRLHFECDVITWPQEDNAVSRQTAKRLAAEASVTRARSPIDAYLRVAVRRFRGGVHWVPAGGSSPLGALGHVNAALEFVEQIERSALAPTEIVLPLGSGGTAAGLLVGLSLARRTIGVVGVRVVPRIIGNRGHVLRLAWQTHALIRRHAGERIPPLDSGLLRIQHDAFGGAYGRETADAGQASKELLAAGGPQLDGTYSGKAFGVALRRARELPAGEVLFWLTFDGRWLAPLSP